MGQRMLAVSVPGRDLRDAELAEQLARAEDWVSVDARRETRPARFCHAPRPRR